MSSSHIIVVENANTAQITRRRFAMTGFETISALVVGTGPKRTLRLRLANQSLPISSDRAHFPAVPWWEPIAWLKLVKTYHWTPWRLLVVE
jgi:hypothetical protein